MLVIIVPLRNRSTTRDWTLISRLCARSLRSYCTAGPDTLRVVLVCREVPEMTFSHPALTIISEEFPDPGTDHDARERDKWVKLKRGLVETRHLAPAHFMFADADDLLHRAIPPMVAREPQSHGWIFPHGYAYEEPRSFAYRWPHFDQFCGTSAIVRCLPEELPASMDDPTERFFLLCQGHPVIREFMEKRGTPLQAVPYPAAIYLTGTGENHSGIRLRDWRGRKITLQKLLRARPVTARLRRDFGLTPLS
jgi:hypothetical protein